MGEQGMFILKVHQQRRPHSGVQEGTKYTPLRVPRISVADVLLPTLTTWGRPGMKSRIQLQRGGFSPRVFSLVMSFEGTMVLNVQL